MIGYHVVEERQTKKKPESSVVVAEKVSAENLPVSEELPKADQQLVSRAFNAPEALDAAPVVLESRAITSVSAAQLRLLSEAEPSTRPRTPVSTDWHPAFQKDFESLRTEAIRNPDSPENRATVNTLMEKRQQRLAREGR
jgi:hypothetical protein